MRLLLLVVVLCMLCACEEQPQPVKLVDKTYQLSLQISDSNDVAKFSLDSIRIMEYSTRMYADVEVGDSIKCWVNENHVWYKVIDKQEVN